MHDTHMDSLLTSSCQQQHLKEKIMLSEWPYHLELYQSNFCGKNMIHLMLCICQCIISNKFYSRIIIYTLTCIHTLHIIIFQGHRRTPANVCPGTRMKTKWHPKANTVKVKFIRFICFLNILKLCYIFHQLTKPENTIMQPDLALVGTGASFKN